MNHNLSITVIFELFKMFNTWKIEVIAREIGFSKRIIVLISATFFKTFTICNWSAHDVTIDIKELRCQYKYAKQSG